MRRSAEFQRETRSANEIPVAADLIEGSQPGAEGTGVLVPPDTRRFNEKLRGIGAQQMMGVRGERGQAIGCAGEFDSGRGRFIHDASPKRMLLKGAQHHSAVSNALIPGVADK